MAFINKTKSNGFRNFFVIVLFFVGISVAEAGTITLSEAVNIALKSNPRMRASQSKIDAAAASIMQVRGGGLPKLDLEVNGSRSNNPLTVFADKLSQGNASFADFGANQYTGVNTLNVKPAALDSPGYYNNWNTGVVLNIPLFSSGETAAKIKKSQSLLKAAQHGDQNARTELTYDVLQAYEGVHVADRLVQIAKYSLKAADDYLELTKSLQKQSMVIESDVFLAENYRRSAAVTLEAAIAESKNQLDAFRALLGERDSDYSPGLPAHLSLPEQSVEALKSRANLSNAQLQVLKSDIEAYRADMSAAYSNYWPKLNLQLRHDWNAQHVSLGGASNTAMLEMNWELFSSGAQYGATKQAAAQYEQAYAELDNAANNINLSVSQTLRAIRTAKIQREASDINARRSMQIVAELKRRYGQGILPLGQLLDAQSRLDTVTAQQVMANYNLLLAKAKLLALVNELTPTIENIKA